MKETLGRILMTQTYKDYKSKNESPNLKWATAWVQNNPGQLLIVAC